MKLECKSFDCRMVKVLFIVILLIAPAINQMQLQPMVNYTFRDNPNRYLSFSPTITANWEASGDERWTVPISLGLGQLLKFGHQSVNLQATTYYNVVTPPGSAHWTLELLVQFLFPQ